MAAHAMTVQAGQVEGQLGLYERVRRRAVPQRAASKVCAGCREKEARYGFSEDERVDRPRTLCFECFRMEIDRRQRVAAQLARGWNAEQVRLPLADTLNELTVRRRRAQIAARRALAG